MKFKLSSDLELYRQQLEARARIFYSTSEIRLLVSLVGPDAQWVADLHRERGADRDEADGLEPYPLHPGGFGPSPERALEEFAEELDQRERARALD
ncbi:MAG: hypothetical protein JWN04_4898 [Myxococcaceae bacterium]|nr:hypothetical protein [Myxococcaceae bacterium]